jgi:hypothetical protein
MDAIMEFSTANKYVGKTTTTAHNMSWPGEIYEARETMKPIKIQPVRWADCDPDLESEARS